MHDLIRSVAPWVQQVLEQVVGFVGLLFFAFFGLLGALAKFRVRILPFLVGATIVWVVLGLVAIGTGARPFGLGGMTTPHVQQAWLSSALVKRAAFAWLAGTGIGIGLIAITVLYEKFGQSRVLHVGSLVMRTAFFLAAFMIYLRLYVIRG